MTEKQKQYQRKYRLEHKDEILVHRKKKYKTDYVYRLKQKERASRYYYQKTGRKNLLFSRIIKIDFASQLSLAKQAEEQCFSFLDQDQSLQKAVDSVKLLLDMNLMSEIQSKRIFSRIYRFCIMQSHPLAKK